MLKILLPTPDAPPKRGGVARYIGATLRARNDIDLDVLPEHWGTVRVFLHLLCHPEKAGAQKTADEGSSSIMSSFLKISHFVRDDKARNITNIWTHHIFPVGTACYLLSALFVIIRCRHPYYTVFLHGLDFDLARRNVWKRFLARRVLKNASHIVTNSASLQKEVSAFVGRDDVQVVYPCVSNELVIASQTTRKGIVHRTPEDLARLFVTQMVAMTGAGISASRHPGLPVHRSLGEGGDPGSNAIRKTMDPGLAHRPATAEGSVSGMTNVVRLLTVARLVERKGHTKVLDAMVGIPHVTYTIVGDGPMRELLKKKAEELGITNRVTFHTEVTDAELPEIYAAHDIFIMPTTKSARDREGFGIVYAEAGIFGLPCIATNIPGVDEAIVHEETGLLIEDTPQALSEALKKLAASPGLRSRMGTAARKRVLESFTEEEFGRRIREV